MFRSRIGNIFGVAYRAGFCRMLYRIPRALPVAIGAAAVDCVPKPKKEEFVFDAKTLEHDFLIKQATTVNVNAATQLLTVTIIAIKDTSEKLRTALANEIALVKEAMEKGDCTPPSHWDNLVAIRCTLGDIKKSYCELISYMTYVEKVAVAAAEMSYLSGNQVASDALCQRIEHAKRTVTEQKDMNQKLQMESLEMQKQAIACSPLIQDKLEDCLEDKVDRKPKNCK